MTTLDQLFDSERVRPQSADVIVDPEELQRVLNDAALPHPFIEERSSHIGRRRPKSRRRGHDWMTAGAIAIAVVTGLGGIGIATAQAVMRGPEASAIEGLAADEGTLVNDELTLTTARAVLDEDLRARLSVIPALKDAVAGLGDSVDPAIVTDAAEGIAAFETGLTQITLPDPMSRYDRGDLDPTSLESIAAAVDSVREQALEVSERRTAITDARMALTALDAAFDTELGELAAAVATSGNALIEASPDAEPAFRDQLAAVLSGKSGSFTDHTTAAAALVAFRSASVALTEDQARAEEQLRIEQEQREERERLERERLEREQNQSNQNGSNEPDGEDPGYTEPDDPEEPIDPTDPEPPIEEPINPEPPTDESDLPEVPEGPADNADGGGDAPLG